MTHHERWAHAKQPRGTWSVPQWAASPEIAFPCSHRLLKGKAESPLMHSNKNLSASPIHLLHTLCSAGLRTPTAEGLLSQSRGNREPSFGEKKKNLLCTCFLFYDNLLQKVQVVHEYLPLPPGIESTFYPPLAGCLPNRLVFTHSEAAPNLAWQYPSLITFGKCKCIGCNQTNL